MKILRGGVWRFSIVLLLVLSSETAVSAQPAIFYVYDNLNRLVGVIDQQGNVADTDVGYTEGKEKELAEKIDKLLAGKPVYTPEELRMLRELAKN